MTEHYDALETRAPAKRETELFSRLPDVLRKAVVRFVLLNEDLEHEEVEGIADLIWVQPGLVFQYGNGRARRPHESI